MKLKKLTTIQVANLKGIKLKTLQKQLLRDQGREKKDRKYPGARKIGRDWFISEKDI